MTFMREVEVKILDIDREALIKKLVELGAERVFDGEMRDVYYDYDHGGIGDNGGLVRLRQQGDSVMLVFKTKKELGEAKVREEHETPVGSFEDAEKILSHLGLKPCEERHKNRTSYVKGEVHYEFDKYLGEDSFVPEFLEIEAPNEEMLFAAVEELGFRKEDTKPWSTADVVEYYESKG